MARSAVQQALANARGWVNPYAPDVYRGRTDQGVDWIQSQPYLAPTAGTIAGIDPNWYKGTPAIYLKFDQPYIVPGTSRSYPGACFPERGSGSGSRRGSRSPVARRAAVSASRDSLLRSAAPGGRRPTGSTPRDSKPRRVRTGLPRSAALASDRPTGRQPLQRPPLAHSQWPSRRRPAGASSRAWLKRGIAPRAGQPATH